MPRINPGSLVVPLDIRKPHTLVTEIRRLLSLGVRRSRLLLEPVLMDVKVNSRVYSVIVNPPSLVILPEDVSLIRDNVKGLIVAKDTWTDYVVVDLEKMLMALEALNNEGNFVINDFEVKVVESVSTCKGVVVVERRVLHYPVVSHVELVDYNSLEEIIREFTRGKITPLLICVDNKTYKPLAWLEVDKGGKKLVINKLIERVEWALYGSLLDVLIYYKCITLGES